MGRAHSNVVSISAPQETQIETSSPSSEDRGNDLDRSEFKRSALERSHMYTCHTVVKLDLLAENVWHSLPRPSTPSHLQIQSSRWPALVSHEIAPYTTLNFLLMDVAFKSSSVLRSESCAARQHRLLHSRARR